MSLLGMTAGGTADAFAENLRGWFVVTTTMDFGDTVAVRDSRSGSG
jgi:hypothetical protein